MAKVSASDTINKPIEEVFDYVASPVNGPAFIPNLNENTNIHPEQVGLGQKFDWRFNLAGVDMKGNAEVIEFVRPNKVIIKCQGDTNATWIFTFQEETGGTKITAEIEYDIMENALQRMANRMVIDKLNQRSAEQMMENIKTILEG